MTKNLLIEASPFDPVTSNYITVRMTMRNGSSDCVQVNNQQWLPVMLSAPELSWTLASDGNVTGFEASAGKIDVALDTELGSMEWSRYNWTGAYLRIFVGDVGAPWSGYEQYLEGFAGSVAREGRVLTISLSTAEALLNISLLSATYAGTGGQEGPTTLKGTKKPFALGQCDNVEPILIDAAYRVYQYHGYGASNDVTAVYENAVSLGAPVSVAANYSSLIGASLQPGQWIKCPALGMFRLGAQNTGKITADVQGAKDGSTYVTSVAAITALLLKTAGIAAANINQTSLNASGAGAWCYYAKDDINIGELAREAYTQAGGYLFADGAGKWRAGRYYKNGTATALYGEKRGQPAIRSIKMTADHAPVWKVEVGNRRVWSTHSLSEISSALSETVEAAAAAKAAADAAHDEAVAAQADADAALSRLNSISADNILDRAEKAYIVREFATLTAERSGILSRAAAMSPVVSTTAYTNAYNTLNSYLTGLSPAYTDTSADTAISRTTWNSNWQAVYNQRQAVFNEIDRVSAEYVGGKTAAEIVTAYNNFNARNDRNAAAIAAPTIASDGTAITHTINTDGSANLAFKWSWGGSNDDIDGFRIVYRSAMTSGAYAIGTTPAEEQVDYIPADRRAYQIAGVAADRYWTFYV